jgi:hypothetical protein
MAPHFGYSFWRLSAWESPNLVATRGGGGGIAWVALSRAFPKHNEYICLPRSPYLHDFSLIFWMLYSPFNTALLLVLLQPSGDGNFRLCSSKSSFRCTPFMSPSQEKCGRFGNWSWIYQLRNIRQRDIITINVPLILKMREIIFILLANFFMGHFKGYFGGAKTFLTPKLSRAEDP